MKFSNRFFSFIFISLSILIHHACSVNVDQNKYLNVKMLATLIAPESATGSFDPVSQKYTLEGIYLSPDPTTGEEIELFDADPKEFTIIERSQIIFSKEIDSNWVGENFDKLTIRFNSEVTGTSKFTDDHSFTLSDDASTDVNYETSFQVEKGQGLEAIIKVQWKNTVVQDANDEESYNMSAPAFDFSVSLN
ncbi:MAG: hypothetical protein R3B45_13260 [Bdellovibrionota bacterium]